MSARDDDWDAAKRLCRLSAEDVRMAKALGLNPRKLMKNIASPHERWKAPVRELYRKRHGGGPAEEPPAVGTRPSASAQVQVHEPDENAGEDDTRLPSELPWEEEIREEDRQLLQRQEDFRAGADCVTGAFAELPFVERV